MRLGGKETDDKLLQWQEIIPSILLGLWRTGPVVWREGWDRTFNLRYFYLRNVYKKVRYDHELFLKFLRCEVKNM